MAVDTREKRLAFLSFEGGYPLHTLFNPDGDVGIGDRGSLLGLYSYNFGIEKRLQFLEFGGGYSWHTLPNPDGNITSVDRGHLLGLYNLLPTIALDINLGDVRLAPVLYSGFRPHKIVGDLISLHSDSSIVAIKLSVNRHLHVREDDNGGVISLSTVAATLDVSDQIFFVAIVSSSGAVIPSLDVDREMKSVSNSLSLITAVNSMFINLGIIQIPSISDIEVMLFGQFISDLGTIRLSPLSSPGYDFFVPAPVSAPFETIISNISAMLPTLSVTKDFGTVPIVSVSTSVVSLSTGTVTFSASIASVGVVGA